MTDSVSHSTHPFADQEPFTRLVTSAPPPKSRRYNRIRKATAAVERLTPRMGVPGSDPVGSLRLALREIVAGAPQGRSWFEGTFDGTDCKDPALIASGAIKALLNGIKVIDEGEPGELFSGPDGAGRPSTLKVLGYDIDVGAYTFAVARLEVARTGRPDVRTALAGACCRLISGYLRPFAYLLAPEFEDRVVEIRFAAGVPQHRAAAECPEQRTMA